MTMRVEEPDLFSALPSVMLAGSTREWTREQQDGITTVGHDLLISAAAGSGKTSVLAERCVHLVCDAQDRCDVDELLVVTFTEAAAAEMKGRIQTALRKRADAAPSEPLFRQIALVDRAQVSTLHAFCSRVLRQHFHQVGIDPTFSVLDADEAKLLRREVAREVIEDQFERDDDGRFARLVDYYADGDADRIADQVIRIHDMLTSVRDPQAWSKRAIERIQEAAGPLEHSELGRGLIDQVRNGLDALRVLCDQTADYIRRLGGFDKYIAVLMAERNAVDGWQNLLADEGFDALAADVPTDFDPLPRYASGTPGKDAAKRAMDAFRGALKEGRWREPLAFTEAEWASGVEQILPFARVFLDTVDEFTQSYARHKSAARTVDFADLERFALKALTEPQSPSSAALAYRSQFKHVLVDEYQDINEVQDAILTLVSRDRKSGSPARRGKPTSPSWDANLFCVGDVKQSIYRFRLADPERFLARQKAYRAQRSPRDGKVIDLRSNFRSRAPLLAAVNSVFERLMTEQAADIDYDESHRLIPGLTFPPPPAGEEHRFCRGAPIELIALESWSSAAGSATDGPDADRPDSADCSDNDSDASELDRTDREAIVVAHRIRELLGLLPNTAPRMIMERDSSAPGGWLFRPLRRGDIVILLRAMKFKADTFAGALRRVGIPTYAESGSGFFAATEIRDTLALLALLDNRRQDFPLVATLRSPMGKLPHAEDMLARIRVAFPEQGTPFHQAAERYAKEKDDELAAHLRDFYARLDSWRFLSQRRPLAELIWTIYEETGYLAFVSGQDNGEQRVANLTSLHQRATQFGKFHQQGLSRFLDFIGSLGAESEMGQASLASEAQDVVRIMSIHKSKGLEFPVVIVPDLGKKINLSDCGGSILADRKTGFAMMTPDPLRRVRYPSLASMLVQQRIRQQSLAEELRVLYVAMTRAKEHLILVGTVDAKLPEQWASRWGNHEGPFSTDMVLGVNSMIDWVGPVYAATGGDAGDVMRLTTFSMEDVYSLQDSLKSPSSAAPIDPRFARLEPLDPAPALSPQAEALIERLTRVDPFSRFIHIAASLAATHGKLKPMSFEEMPSVRDDAEESIMPVDLRMPTFVAKSLAPAANEIGTVTHLVLEHFDYSTPCDAAAATQQINALVERKLLTEAQGPWVDIEAIIWFCNSELGIRIREQSTKLLREIALYLSRDPSTIDQKATGAEPLDNIMIRGRIDALLNLDAGGVLIDYKTDGVLPDAVPARAETYRPQLEAYACALQTMTGTPVAETWLVFLKPRVLHRLQPLPARL